MRTAPETSDLDPFLGSKPLPEWQHSPFLIGFAGAVWLCGTNSHHIAFARTDLEAAPELIQSNAVRNRLPPPSMLTRGFISAPELPEAIGSFPKKWDLGVLLPPKGNPTLHATWHKNKSREIQVLCDAPTPWLDWQMPGPRRGANARYIANAIGFVNCGTVSVYAGPSEHDAIVFANDTSDDYTKATRFAVVMPRRI